MYYNRLFFLLFFIYLNTISINIHENYNKYYYYITNIKHKNLSIQSEIKYYPPFNDKDLILPKIIEYDVLLNISNNFNPRIVIAVLSSPHNFKKRYSFRYNSKKYCNNNIKCRIIFFIGYSNKEMMCLIGREVKLFNDLVQFSFQNSYLNLTLLSIMSLKYCFKYFNKIQYYIKTDDDMLINYNLLFKLLKNMNYNSKIIYGHLANRQKAIRNNKSKSYIPYFEYPHTYVPKYVYGGLIVTTKASLKLIYNQTLYEQHYVWKEDVNLGILSSISGNNIMQFPNNIDINLRVNKCKILNNIIAFEINSYEDNFYCIK